MILSALFVAAALSSSAGLDAAQDAFARGDYGRAETLALAEAHPPLAGAALYLVGLSRFRAGLPAEALEALDQSWRAPDRPAAALWHFNRASCLYELGRFGEAEEEYLQAAGLDPSLAAVSLIDAAFAALDGGSPSRAQALAARARPSASGSAAGLLADLDAHLAATGRTQADAEYGAGLDAFDTGQFSQAREHFLRASTLDPADGKSRIMSGASALQLGLRTSAREEFDQALALSLEPTDAQAARDYLAMLSPGLGARGLGFEGSAHLGVGWDSNALQTGFLQPNEFPGASAASTPSAFATAELGLAYRFRPQERLTAELAYAFDQLVYASSDASDRSLQQHSVTASLELELRAGVRLGGALGAQLALTGLSQLRSLQFSGTGAAWASLDESDLLTSRLDLGYERKAGLGEFDYLGGDRFDAGLSQELRLPVATFGLGYRFRAELIGTAQESVAHPPPEGLCPQGCRQELIDPFGYLGHTLWLSSRLPLGARLAFDLSGGFEWRGYTSDNYLQVVRPDGSASDVDRRRRHDTRAFASAGASFWLLPSLALSLRYDIVINRSDIDSAAADGGGQCAPPEFECHLLDSEVRSYDKHVVTLGTALSF